ncbi:hypothetical protein [Candidatus Regiella insecticola]|uniref:hypothetical protein n=1 Tax=Candidatus Regiella insecticola TaxID=138073 RepID=UPI0005865417|nr:hypothetical protein [Candidatus Regiella insecticola]
MSVDILLQRRRAYDTLLDDIYPMNFELRQGGQGDRPMSVDMLPDEASAGSQRRRNLKGQG